MNPNPPQFITLFDSTNRPFHAFDTSLITSKLVRPQNASLVGINYCTFLSDTLKLSRHATGRYSSDLTERDDIILAILSVLLILVIEGILTTILLRTNRGNADSFGFSIKYFIELARGLKPSHLLKSKGKRKKVQCKKMDVKLLFVAGAILSLTFGFEILILLMSTPELRDVHNTDDAFQIKEIETPDWNEIQRTIDSAITRPCSAITLEMPGIDQGKTQISACVSLKSEMAIFQSSLQQLERTDKEVNYTIVTHAHEFGAEHNITINHGDRNETANYIVRAYYTLGDAKIRIMTKRRFQVNFEQRVEMLHKQFFAYLFSEYSNRIPDDKNMNLERLNNLQFQFKTENGPFVNIVQILKRQRFRQVAAVKHITTVRGIIPTGTPAFLFAQAVFKGGFGLGLSGPDRYDLILGTGQTPPAPSVVWRESGRPLNWLSLTIALILGTGVLVGLRYLLKPTGTAEIAFLYFAGAPGSNSSENALQLSEEESKYFRLPDWSGGDSDSSSQEKVEGQTTSLSEYTAFEYEGSEET